MKKFHSLLRATALLGWLTLTLPVLADPPAPKPTLLELARKKFAAAPLSELEEKLVVATESGEETSMLSADESENVLSLAEHWSDGRAIRAEVLRWLCVNKEAAEQITPRGIRIAGIRIDGDLDLSNAKLIFPFFATRCAFGGKINFDGAHTRSLDFSGCLVTELMAKGAEIEGSVALANGFTTNGELNFAGATIAGVLDCRRSDFIRLVADGAKIAQSLDLREAKGQMVNLLGASIGGSLEAEGANLSNPGAWWSLLADRAKITGNVFLRRNRMTGEPFRAAGQVNFLGASIGGSLECDGAELSDPPPGDALLLVDRARVGGNIFLRDGFCCDGLADFTGAEATSLVWAGARVTNNTVLTLRSTKLAVLRSDNKTWPKPENVTLDELVYGRLNDFGGIDSGRLLDWLALQPTDQFYPQPFEQLALVLRAMGFEKDAREVMIAKNSRRSDFTKSFTGPWVWYNVVGPLIGYGYRPGYAFGWSLLFIALGAGLFWAGYRADVIVPTKPGGYATYGGTPDPAGSTRPRFSPDYPKFNAFVFSLESFTPLLRLDQSSNWAPNAHRGTAGRLLRIYLWCHIIAGWVLTSLWVGSVTGLVKT